MSVSCPEAVIHNTGFVRANVVVPYSLSDEIDAIKPLPPGK
jgi:hypothetical protein